MAVFTKQQRDSFKESTEEVKKLLTTSSTVEQVKISDIKRSGATMTEESVILHPTGDGITAKGWTTFILIRPNGTGLTIWANPEEHDLDLDSPTECQSIKYRMAKDSKDTGFLVEFE